MTRRTRPLLWQIGLPIASFELVVFIALLVLIQTQLQSTESGPLLSLIIAGGLCAIALTLVGAFFTGRLIKRQSDAIASTTVQFGRADFSTQIGLPASSELADLAIALDRMGDQLNAHIAELRLQQRQQRAILQSMSNAVLAVDTEQRISMINRAAEDLLGLRADAVRGRLLQEVIRQPEMHGFVQRALTDPSPQQAEMRLHGDPSITVQATSGPLTTVDGAPAGLLMVLNDVTELRRLESLRSEFAANVSHELRTPITNLKGYVETLLEVGMSDEAQATRFLQVIEHNIDRLAAIVNDIMALTQFERPRSRERLQREPTAVTTIAENVLEQFASSADVKHIELKSSIPSDLQVLVQPLLIEQALGNLVANAITYSPPDTTVTIEAQALSDEDVEIAVVDEGPGIASEHLSRLFERFYRVDQARSREVGGTGLGLAIVKHSALSHGGRVDVTSQLDHGSRFVIILPSA